MTGAVVRAAMAAQSFRRSLDAPLVAVFFGLAIVGIVVSFAASPASAARLDLPDPFHFVSRHVTALGVAFLVAGATSTLSPLGARRLAVGLFVACFLLLILTLVVGHEVNGARRWLRLGGASLQPSEFAKPALIVTIAWLLAEARAPGGPPGLALSTGLCAATAALFLLQPDFGQTALVLAAFAVVVFVAGASWRWLAGLAITGAVGAGAAYLAFPHVARRVRAFFEPGVGDTYQVDLARRAIERGGLFGVGPGEGQVKHALPDAHTDFVFAVACEEFGLIFALAVIALFAYVIWRVFARVRRLIDPTARLAAIGLASLLGLQALVNLAVNLQLAPPKGMTLPFISYGGSSLVACGLTAGLLLAFTRRRPGGFVAD